MMSGWSKILAGCAAALALAHPSLAAAPETSSRPVARPDIVTAEPPSSDAVSPQTDGNDAAATPPPKRPIAPTPKQDQPPAPLPVPMPQQLADSAADRALCQAELTRLGVSFVEQPSMTSDENRDCGIAHPLEVSSLGEGLALAPAATLRCDTALAAAKWAHNWLRPAADEAVAELGELREIRHASAYVCRNRNNAETGKMSEHAFGNALDITAIEFEKDVVVIEPRADSGDLTEAFQKTIRSAACLYFTTVIGPGTDAAHSDHLHLDVKERRGGFRLCQ